MRPWPRRTFFSQIHPRTDSRHGGAFCSLLHPLPGDRIVGIVTTGKGVTIHTIDCDTLESFSEAPERWIDVGWDSVSEGARGIYTGRLKITVANEPGSLRACRP